MTDELQELRERVAALERKLEGRETITHIQVERADVVESDGQLRLTATNRSQSPETSVDGVTVPGRGRAGLIFFNDKGDECGGLAFGGEDSMITFDRVDQDQALSLRYSESGNGRYLAGLTIQERGPGGVAGLSRELERIKTLPTEERREAYAELEATPGTGQTRIFVGREHSGASLLTLADAAGRPRIELKVSEDGATSISILDESGAVQREL